MRSKRPIFGLALALAAGMASSAAATTVYEVIGPAQGPGYASPGNATDWTLGDTRNNGQSFVSTAQPRSGNGSLQIQTFDSGDKASALLGSARWFNTPVLGTLGDLAQGSLAFEFYRDSSSTVASHIAPAFQLEVRNAAGESANLKWEATYNGYPTTGPGVPTDQWVSIDMTDGNFWMWDGQLRAQFDLTLDDWVSGEQVGDSVVLGSDTEIVGFGVQAGSGWAGEFLGYVDNIEVSFDGGSAYAANFEVVPLPAAAWAGFVLLGGMGGVRAWKRRRTVA